MNAYRDVDVDEVQPELSPVVEELLDSMFEPRPGCCMDCDEALDALAATGGVA